MRLPWENIGKADAVPKYDPFMFVRLRIQRGNHVQFVGIRADDTDITGKIALDDGTTIAISSWGVPTKNEPFMKSEEVLREIAKYAMEQGLTIVEEAEKAE